MLHPDWKKTLTKAWSVRFTALAFALTGTEVFFAVYGPPASIPLGLFATLSGITTAAAFAARLYAQKGYDNAD